MRRLQLLADLQKDDVARMSLNTGTQFDLATGKFEPGVDGKMYLNGGLNMINSVVGRPQTYKSSIALGYFGRALRYYTDTQGLCWDTELTVAGVKRLVNLAGEVDNPQLAERITLVDKTKFNLETFYEQIIAIAEDRHKHRKDYIEETPFLDPYGKPIKAWVPTLIACDSFTKANTGNAQDLFSKVQITDKKTNMFNMGEGKAKTNFIDLLPLAACSKGMYFVFTGHVGNKMKLDPYAPIDKDLPYMRPSDEIKGVGTSFNFLSTNLLDTRRVGVLINKGTKKSEYPGPINSDVELQYIQSIICRCKNNASGSGVHHISSQHFGIQDTLENFHYIRNFAKNLLGASGRYKAPLIDKSFNRNNIREFINDDYEFRRVIEIIGQYVYIYNNWNLPGMNLLPPNKLIEMLVNTNKELSSRLVNSTGIWTFLNQKVEREYLSIMDIVALINKNK